MNVSEEDWVAEILAYILCTRQQVRKKHYTNKLLYRMPNKVNIVGATYYYYYYAYCTSTTTTLLYSENGPARYIYLLDGCWSY